MEFVRSTHDDKLVAVPGQIDLWWVDLKYHRADYEACCFYLPEDQQRRLSRFVHREGRLQYAVSHAALNTILSQYTGVPPLELRFVDGEKGKPLLMGSTLSFNLSHSHHAAMIAVSNAPTVGVDVEWVRHKSGLIDIAERYFSKQELRWIEAAAGEEEGVERFYRVWVCKEAYLKAVGVGLTVSLDQFFVRFDLRNEQFSLGGQVEPGGYALRHRLHKAGGQQYALAWCWRGKVDKFRAREWRLSRFCL